jgi:hypothetical protein
MAFARAVALACILPLAAGAQAKTLRVNVTGDPGMIDPIT